MAHTPGPWNIWRKGKHNIPAIANNNAVEKPPADICELDAENENREDDALLIVAAPEMLKFCEDTLAALQGFRDACVNADMIVPYWAGELIDGAEMIIAKAKGS